MLELAEINGIVDLYKKLCDVTHPGSSSVLMWSRPESDYCFMLDASCEEKELRSMLDEFRPIFLEILLFAFSPAILTLKLLLMFPIKELHVAALGAWDCSSIPSWIKAERAILKQSCTFYH